MTTIDNLEYYEIVFPRLGIDINVKSEAFTIFGMTITWYGIIIVTGMLLAMIYGFRQMRRVGIDPDRAIDAVIGGVIGGVVGARAYFVAFHWEDYAGDIKSIFNTRGGGLAIYGGVIGAFLVGGLICKLRKVKLLPMLDVAAVSFLIGQGIGRWGNFTNHEAFGANTDSLFGMSSGKIQAWIINNTAHLDTLYSKGVTLTEDRPVHPCFLYESVWCLVGFALLAYIFKKHRLFDGQMLLMYLCWYGTGRFFIEGLRTDSLYIGTLRVSQVVALVTAVASLIVLIAVGTKVKRMGGDYHFYCETAESKALLAESAAKDEAFRKKHAGEETLAAHEQILGGEADDTEESAEASDEKTDPEEASEPDTKSTQEDK